MAKKSDDNKPDASASGGGGMSQDEINAMMAGLGGDDSAEEATPPATPPSSSAPAGGGGMSQDEINAMMAGLGGDDSTKEATPEAVEAPSAIGGALSQDEINAMLFGAGGDGDNEAGASPEALLATIYPVLAAAIQAQLGQAVTASTPQVSSFEAGTLTSAWTLPFTSLGDSLMLIVNYGKTEADSTIVMVPVDQARQLVLAKAPDTPASAVGEALNDAENKVFSTVVSALCDTLSSSLTAMLPQAVKVLPPDILIYSADMVSAIMPALETEAFISVDVSLTLANGQVIALHQLWPIAEATSQADRLLQGEIKPMPALASVASPQQTATAEVNGDASRHANATAVLMPPSGGGNATSAPSSGYASQPPPPVTVQPVQFAAFDQQPNLHAQANTNLDLVMDITLNMTVELGKAEVSIKDVLELTRGSVIELDRIAGEPVDLLANGKLIAKGEVVVIEDSFGLRITSIVSPAERLRSL
jgi:flagellar motor switch protein FliN